MCLFQILILIQTYVCVSGGYSMIMFKSFALHNFLLSPNYADGSTPYPNGNDTFRFYVTWNKGPVLMSHSHRLDNRINHMKELETSKKDYPSQFDERLKKTMLVYISITYQNL